MSSRSFESTSEWYATAHVLPTYTGFSKRILRRHASSREVTSFNLLDRFWLMLRCPSHEWSWPRNNEEWLIRGFDAHQTCYKCDSTRLFDSREWQSGPIYRRSLSHYSHLPAKNGKH